jgi:hypothetical protein
MGNDYADAIRDALGAAVREKYGDWHAAAAALRIPYKTLYRAFTRDGKDRTAKVSLDLIMDVCDKSGISFDEVSANARKRIQQ